MPLASGTRLGPTERLGAIEVWGMGARGASERDGAGGDADVEPIPR